MSKQEQPKSFMEELDLWVEDHVIDPLQEQWSRAQDGDMAATSAPIRKAIREKVLESYHNGKRAGQAAGQRRSK